MILSTIHGSPTLFELNIRLSGEQILGELQRMGLRPLGVQSQAAELAMHRATSHAVRGVFLFLYDLDLTVKGEGGAPRPRLSWCELRGVGNAGWRTQINFAYLDYMWGPDENNDNHYYVHATAIS